MRIGHKIGAPDDTRHGLTAVNQCGIYPGVTVHDVKVITRADIAREAGCQWQLRSFGNRYTLKLLINLCQLGIENASGTRQGQTARHCPHEVNIQTACLSVTNVL